MHNHTIYSRGNTFYLNYTKNSKRHRTSLNKLIKSLNLENDEALAYLKGLSLEKILKMQKEASKAKKNDFRSEIKVIFKRFNRAYSYPCVLSNLQSGRSLK